MQVNLLMEEYWSLNNSRFDICDSTERDAQYTRTEEIRNEVVKLAIGASLPLEFTQFCMLEPVATGTFCFNKNRLTLGHSRAISTFALYKVATHVIAVGPILRRTP